MLRRRRRAVAGSALIRTLCGEKDLRGGAGLTQSGTERNETEPNRAGRTRSTLERYRATAPAPRTAASSSHATASRCFPGQQMTVAQIEKTQRKGRVSERGGGTEQRGDEC